MLIYDTLKSNQAPLSAFIIGMCLTMMLIYLLDQTVFVTAVDVSHFEESKDSIASIQKHIPVRHKIIYYDLGLSKDQVETVSRVPSLKKLHGIL